MRICTSQSRQTALTSLEQHQACSRNGFVLYGKELSIGNRVTNRGTQFCEWYRGQLSGNDSNASETVPPMKKGRSRLYLESFCIQDSGHGLRTTHHVVVSRPFTILRCEKLFLLFISLKTRAN